MNLTIYLKNTTKGIGLDFYSEEDNKSFLELKNELKNKFKQFNEGKLDWNIDNNQLNYPDNKINNELKDTKIILKH